METARGIQIRDVTRNRYASLAVSGDWELSRLRKARALVAGCGALGNEVCKNLAMMGVRLVVPVDADTVEVSNLTRSVFFRERDHGRAKADVLAERMTELNPDVEVFPIIGRIPGAVGLGVVRRCDMVFGCLDSRQARIALNRMCHKTGKAWVDGSMEDLDGDVKVFTPGRGACYECTLPLGGGERTKSCKHIALEAGKAGKVPTTSTMGSIIAALQVQEAVKLHQEVRRGSLAGKRLIVNSRINDFFAVELTARDECYGHVSFGDITEVPEWTAAGTTPLDLLRGEVGEVRLGFDLVIGVQCNRCCREHLWETCLRSPIPAAAAVCHSCGADGVNPVVIHTVTESDSIARRTLAELGVPALDILEVRSNGQSRWYELSGDLSRMPAALSQ